MHDGLSGTIGYLCSQLADRGCSQATLELLGTSEEHKKILLQGDNKSSTPMHMCVTKDARQALYGLLCAGVEYTAADDSMWLPLEDAWRAVRQQHLGDPY